ncbi:uncharacterized protein LACBIDRAFT_292782 [Laccaria bicolor S238N-H82]|uniref:Ribosome biogenesis protein NOP53 n=1 Tax=Laccaria bicolor (strain S238N-H82 / ATCC MYA-4686) TaxID=486041 RepID=B0CXP8_LACBS|nr:uncharacterized protein LACBIDRAFT_292782 [Laccaria bicolor S238N-H82]EDR12759.1 predicted protein [Laccaria bicolor S238N-H82]|eukprot:XP_001877023.1 predicted protein [Laccaria bicolor S238N-H82]
MPTSKSSSKPASQAKLSKSSLGAPAQHNQSTRKGKRAWRKNINIEDVEEGLEGMRAEERVIGKPLQKTKDEDLFVVDVQGDEQVRKSLASRFSSRTPLTSTKILSERSAVPAVFSRPSNATSKRKAGQLSYEEKARLLKIAKRPRRGPFNSILDPSEYEAGSGMVGLSEAVKSSGTHDAWAPEVAMDVLPDGMETVQKKVIKPPTVKYTRDIIQVPAIVEPHQGTSYNPPVEAHHELILKAYEAEEKRLRDAEKLAEVKKKMEDSYMVEPLEEGLAAGMKLAEKVLVEDDEAEEEKEERVVKSVPDRKTASQKNKAKRLLAEKRALAERAEHKRMIASISNAKIMRRSTARLLSEQEKKHLERRLALEEKVRKQGLVGQKLGKHKVPQGEVEVQLGEDLSESLRGLKPEGNLFKDRFLSLQQRALIEPRVRVLPKKRRLRIVEYEKHAWKRFQ